MALDCSRKECPGIGHYIPILLVRKSKKSTPIRAELHQLKLCEGHRLKSVVTDFLSDEGWDKIAKHLREAGMGPFSKNLTTLDWREVEKTNEAESDSETLAF